MLEWYLLGQSFNTDIRFNLDAQNFNHETQEYGLIDRSQEDFPFSKVATYTISFLYVAIRAIVIFYINGTDLGYIERGQRHEEFYQELLWFFIGSIVAISGSTVVFMNGWLVLDLVLTSVLTFAFYTNFILND